MRCCSAITLAGNTFAINYNINVKAELEIEALHAKIDDLREKEVLSLTTAIGELSRLLEAKQNAAASTT